MVVVVGGGRGVAAGAFAGFDWVEGGAAGFGCWWFLEVGVRGL